MTVEKIKNFIEKEHNKKFKCSSWFYHRLNAMLDELDKDMKKVEPQEEINE